MAAALAACAAVVAVYVCPFYIPLLLDTRAGRPRDPLDRDALATVRFRAFCAAGGCLAATGVLWAVVSVRVSEGGVRGGTRRGDRRREPTPFPFFSSPRSARLSRFGSPSPPPAQRLDGCSHMPSSASLRPAPPRAPL